MSVTTQNDPANCTGGQITGCAGSGHIGGSRLARFYNARHLARIH